jgi:hypothetical protein
MSVGNAREATSALPRLGTAAAALRGMEPARLAGLLADCRRTLEATAADWVETSVRRKGWQTIAVARAEEWISGPLPVARLLHLLHDLHAGLALGHLPRLVRLPTPAPDGLASWSALPAKGLADPLLLFGYRARLDAPTEAQQTAPERAGNVALVLGAGNVTATPVLDVLHQVFLRGRAVLLKLSPLHRELAPLFDQALRPLVDASLVALCEGDATFGSELAHDPAVAAVHLTGSADTWHRLRTDATLANKELTAEVGCCTPVLVVPGHYRRGELRHLASQLAGFAAMNGGATCLAPRLVLTAQGWPQREQFLQLLREALAGLPPRVPFHPTARRDFERATQAPFAGEALPPVLCAGLPAKEDERYRSEHFAPVLLEVPLPAATTTAWLDAATGFVRDHVYGALSAYAFAPRTIRDEHRTAIDRAVVRLPHGTIAINTWTGLGYGLGTTPWGAPPDAAPEHGRGWAHGTSCLGSVQRTVIEAPFRPRPLPPWLPGHRRGEATLRALCRYYLAPNPLRLARTAALALCSR